VVDWYSPYAGWESSPLYGGWFHVGSGPLYCFEQSSGDGWNDAFMASIDNGWWEVDCYNQLYADTPVLLLQGGLPGEQHLRV